MILRDGYFTTDNFSDMRHLRNFDYLSLVNNTAFMNENPGNGS